MAITTLKIWPEVTIFLPSRPLPLMFIFHPLKEMFLINKMLDGESIYNLYYFSSLCKPNVTTSLGLIVNLFLFRSYHPRDSFQQFFLRWFTKLPQRRMRRRIRPLSAQSQYTNSDLNPREQCNSETPSRQKKTAHPVDRERSGYEIIESLMRGKASSKVTGPKFPNLPPPTARR